MKGKIRARSVRKTCTEPVEVFAAKNCSKAAPQNLRRISKYSLSDFVEVVGDGAVIQREIEIV